MDQQRVSYDASVSASASGDTPSGFAYTLAAYLLWGFMPLYMKAVSHIPAIEMVAHRMVWSVPIAGLVLLLLGRAADIRRAFRQPRTLMMAAVTAVIISINWAVYVWAISVDRTVETALGYYINPLVNMLLGAVFLGERFTRAQLVALALATMAVVVLTVDAGGLPWVSLTLALSFATYSYLRKTLPVGPSQGFFLEVLILSVPCSLYLISIEANGTGAFFDSSYNFWMLLAAGPVTAIPLILFAFGAKLLRMSTIGIMQYISPTMIAIFGIFVFQEPFGPMRMLAFGMIWAALAIYTWSMFTASRR